MKMRKTPELATTSSDPLGAIAIDFQLDNTLQTFQGGRCVEFLSIGREIDRKRVGCRE